MNQKTKNNFDTLDAESRNKILCSLALDEKWGELMELSEYIQPHKSNSILNGSTLHKWLLMHPDKGAFEIWKKIRSNPGRLNKDYGWRNSAALLLYSNLPERLIELKVRKDSMGSVFGSDLKKIGIGIKPNVTLSQKSKNEIEDNYSSPIELAFLQHYLDKAHALSKASHAIISEKDSNLLQCIRYYFMAENPAPIEPLMDFFTSYASKRKQDEKDEIMAEFFMISLEYMDEKEIEPTWNKLGDTSKLICAKDMEREDNYRFINDVFFKRKIKTIEIIQDLEVPGHRKLEIYYGFNRLRVCLMDELISHANFLIKKNRNWLKWLEHEVTVKINPHLNGEGTLLVLCVMEDKKKAVDFLLEQGARLEPLSEFINSYNAYKEKMGNHTSILDDNSRFNNFSISVENILLRRKFKVDNGYKRSAKNNVFL